MAITPKKEILTCLDYSGSVATHGWTYQLVNSYNDYIAQQKGLYPNDPLEPDNDPIATSYNFTYESRYNYNRIKLQDVPAMPFTYEFRGITALFDSMGLIMAGAYKYQNKVEMAIFTDNFDNASHIYSHSSVYNTTKNYKSAGWKFKLYTSGNNTAYQDYAVFRDYYSVYFI